MPLRLRSPSNVPNGGCPMQEKHSLERLSLIPTMWSLVHVAHHGSAEEARAAKQTLLSRYGDAVRRYLRKLLRKPEDADEVFQEFAVRLLHGDLHGADPHRGRF